MDEKKQFIDDIIHFRYEKVQKIVKSDSNIIEQICKTKYLSERLAKGLGRWIDIIPMATIKLIKKTNIDVNIKDGNGSTLLMYSAVHNRPDVAKFLLENNANINMIDNQNRTALHLSFISHSISIAMILLKQDNINIDNDKIKLEDHLQGYDAYLAIELYKKKMDNQKKYFENLIEQKLREQKEQLYEEIYAPNGIGYEVAKKRFNDHI
jgi:ankyrin repeat protein